jgi:acetyl-CoA acetyltransferase family protein
MAQTAEKIAKRLSITRQAQDEFALRSHQLGAAAVKEGRFAEEIAPYVISTKKGDVVIDKDDHIKPETTLEGLAKLNAAFGKDGTVTAGNASGIVDGAAALVVTTAERAKADKLDVFALVRAWASVGVDPSEMGIGPVYAVPKLLKKHGLRIEDIDVFELNEAFASQVVYCRDKLGIPMDRLNPNGGAISIGHPFGMTGSRMVGTIANEMLRRKARYGVVTMCIGGGQGAAGLFEACS